MAALFNGSINNQDNIINYISECKTMGIRVLPPDVNHSTKHFTVTVQNSGLLIELLHILKETL
ncbi:MAG: hypothetical protein CM1200mP28_17590 [Deltaproteobacteria bacterium]|nr:MAG: hypothetical protein CM1200mP28_17590 [Deltaproteobacteria bacterium]